MGYLLMSHPTDYFIWMVPVICGNLLSRTMEDTWYGQILLHVKRVTQITKCDLVNSQK